MSEPQITHSAKPTNTTRQAAERLRASAERDRALARRAGTGQWIVDVTDGVVTIVTEVDGNPYADNPFDYESHSDVIAYDISSESTAALMAASRAIVPRQAEQIRVLVDALEEIAAEEPPSYVADEIAEAALDAAWALEAPDA